MAGGMGWDTGHVFLERLPNISFSFYSASSDGYGGSLIFSQPNRLFDLRKKINYFALNFPVTLMTPQPGQNNENGGQEK